MFTKPVKVTRNNVNFQKCLFVPQTIRIPDEFKIGYNIGEYGLNYEVYSAPGLPCGWLLIQGFRVPKLRNFFEAALNTEELIAQVDILNKEESGYCPDPGINSDDYYDMNTVLFKSAMNLE